MHKKTALKRQRSPLLECVSHLLGPLGHINLPAGTGLGVRSCSRLLQHGATPYCGAVSKGWFGIQTYSQHKNGQKNSLNSKMEAGINIPSAGISFNWNVSLCNLFALYTCIKICFSSITDYYVNVSTELTYVTDQFV